MAVCWRSPLSSFDKDSAWSPERYSPELAQQQALAENSVPLATLVTFCKETFNPAGNGINRQGSYIVLDTNHAYEGRIQFRGQPVPIAGVGSIKRPLKSGYVIVSRLRTYLRQVALIDDELFDGFDGEVVCSTEFYVLAPAGDLDIAFLVPFLLSAPVQKAFAAAEEGGHHPRVPPDVLLKLAVPLSMLDTRENLSKRVRQSIQLIRAGERVMAEVHADTRKATALIAPDKKEPEAIKETTTRTRRSRISSIALKGS